MNDHCRVPVDPMPERPPFNQHIPLPMLFGTGLGVGGTRQAKKLVVVCPVQPVPFTAVGSEHVPTRATPALIPGFALMLETHSVLPLGVIEFWHTHTNFGTGAVLIFAQVPSELIVKLVEPSQTFHAEGKKAVLLIQPRLFTKVFSAAVRGSAKCKVVSVPSKLRQFESAVCQATELETYCQQRPLKSAQPFGQTSGVSEASAVFANKSNCKLKMATTASRAIFFKLRSTPQCLNRLARYLVAQISRKEYR